MYLTIDFEDFNHDLKRGLGICSSGPINFDFLWEKYQLINNIFKKSNFGKGSFGTFFCTGIIAEKEPDLIRRIADDGHEIACHYYFHDVMKYENLEIVENNLKKAKSLLEEASGKTIKGFRAPYFNIEKDNSSQYKIVEKLFDYDSSFACNTEEELFQFKRKMNLNSLKVIPIYEQKMAGYNFRLGGSFLKIFPKSYMNWMIKKSSKNGFVPHIYLHPYEFGNSDAFRLKINDLSNLGLKKSIYWRIRQNQWLKFKNNSLIKKVNYIIENNHLDGVLENLL